MIRGDLSREALFRKRCMAGGRDLGREERGGGRDAEAAPSESKGHTPSRNPRHATPFRSVSGEPLPFVYQPLRRLRAVQGARLCAPFARLSARRREGTRGKTLPMLGTDFRHGRRRTGQHMRQDASAL